MNEEYRSLIEKNTCDLVRIWKGRKCVICKWVYRYKYAPYVSFERHKAHLVTKQLSQFEGIDYNETFSFVAKTNSIHLDLYVVASHKWNIHQMDVKYSFLDGDFQEQIYM